MDGREHIRSELGGFFSQTAANAAGRSYLDYVDQNRVYCTQQAQLFQNALDDYLGIEHRNVTEINKPGPQAGI